MSENFIPTGPDPTPSEITGKTPTDFIGSWIGHIKLETQEAHLKTFKMPSFKIEILTL